MSDDLESDEIGKLSVAQNENGALTVVESTVGVLGEGEEKCQDVHQTWMSKFWSNLKSVWNSVFSIETGEEKPDSDEEEF